MIDLAQFHEMFFDECEELLNRADALLPECVPVASPETLGELRRCAHSIKGGSATFGFVGVTGCATELERALGQALASGEPPEPSMLALWGEAFVVLRELVSCQRYGTETDCNRVAQVLGRLARVGAVSGIGEHGARARDCCYEFRFVVSRTVAGVDLLIEDMLERLAGVGRVISTRPPAPEARDGRWQLRVTTTSEVTQAELCEIVGRVADPESLQVQVMETASEDFLMPPALAADEASASADIVSQEIDAFMQAVACDSTASTAHSAERIERHIPMAAANYLVFEVSGQRYAARADQVVEVRACAKLRPLAGAPKAVLGVVDVRGEYVPVIDSRNLLGVTAAPPTRLTPMMMLRVESALVGVLVDEVGDIVAVEASAIQAPHRLLANRGFVQIVGLSRHQGQLLTVIDLVSLVRSVGLARSGMFAIA